MAGKQPSGTGPQSTWKTELLAAATRGDSQSVLRISTYSDLLQLEGRNAVYNKAMHIAASRGDAQSIEYLLCTDVGVDCESKYNNIKTWTPLITASSKGHTLTVEMLLCYGADVNYVSKCNDETCALSQAAKGNHVEVVTTLLEAGANVDHNDRHHLTPLKRAVGKGHLETVKVLLTSGANINYVGDSSWDVPPVMIAVQGGHLEIVKLLCTSGADVSELTGIQALTRAAREGHKEIVEFLLQHGVDVNYEIPPPKKGMITPPLIAASSTEVVEVLLKHGANINVTDKEHRTALMVAAGTGDIDLIKILLKSGADPDKIAYHYFVYQQGFGTALHLAADYTTVDYEDCGYPDRHPAICYAMLRLLLLAGANVKFRELVATDPRIKVIKKGEEVKKETEKKDKEQDVKGEKDDWVQYIWTCNEEEEILNVLEFINRAQPKDDLKDFAECVHLVYAAGATIREIADEDNDDYRRVVQLIQDDQEPLLSLQGLCRRRIRASLLSSTGGNHGNLLPAVPKLPVPKALQKYLLFNVPHIFEPYKDPDELFEEELERAEVVEEDDVDFQCFKQLADGSCTVANVFKEKTDSS